ncbi:MAG: low molecular weight phosphotyrosine protein phosphatase [Rhodoferax sp.]|nr:low molecular weight phosphotyrosine protein phosphatase [Rhodoferax sp.]
MIERVLIICVGNVCRSPLAEALLRQALPQIHIASAGTHASPGAPAHPLIQQIAAEAGLQLQEHRAQRLQPQMVQQTGLVLVMDQFTRNHVLHLYPECRGKIFRLGEYQQSDIPDPMGEPEDNFRKISEQIHLAVRSWQSILSKSRPLVS